ncbi:MAG: hypothetical protein WCS87_02380 [Methylococcaceae bacterium]
MNVNQKKSLQLIDELLNNMDDATFLKKYEAVKCNMGPTIESFLNQLEPAIESSLIQHCFSNLLKTTTRMKSNNLPTEKHCKIIMPAYLSYRGEQNGIFSANDKAYLDQLAA